MWHTGLQHFTRLVFFRLIAYSSILFALSVCGGEPAGVEGRSWIKQMEEVPYPEAVSPEVVPRITLQLLRQDYEQLERNLSVIRTPLVIGTNRFSRGLGTHSFSDIRIASPEPLMKLRASVGVDLNERTKGGLGSVRFVVTADGKEVFRSGILRGGQPAQEIQVDLGGAKTAHLQVDDAADGPSCDHADWAMAQVETRDGQSLWLDELPAQNDSRLTRYPFSFQYGDKHSDELLPLWKREVSPAQVNARRALSVISWRDPLSGLQLEWHLTTFPDFGAIDWVLFLKNTGSNDTPIISDWQSLDIALEQSLAGSTCYRLHRTKGAPSDPTDFEPSLVNLSPGAHQALGGGGGRSSNKDFPFVKVEAADASYIVAVGWSGQWAMDLVCREDRRLHAKAGLELTHFKLHPGESVRGPRILILRKEGDTLEANARFRELIYEHYAARLGQERPAPALFCNTCFTRGGGWLNECNASNQVSLIRAFAPLGLQALITDAGWFEGGWPAGAGNWNPRKDAYPEGMLPVAAAARENGMAYGLWFEFERVVAGTALAQNRADWLLKSRAGPEQTYLLNLGLPEVRKYLLGILRGFMDLPGFGFYRSDFNMDPLPYWRHTDSPDRQGITEMKYIEGLYAFWDEIAQLWPKALREECASGGRRIDLETIMRMHLHQESDYWFDNEVDLAVIWSLSRYLPNCTFTTPLIRLDDRSFHCTMATSLIPGWIADDKGFDTVRAKQLTDIYRRLRQLLVGGFYPLTPYSRDGKQWMALQFDRRDLGEGLVLAVPPRGSDKASLRVQLHGLDSQATYAVHGEISNWHAQLTGGQLMKGCRLTMPTGDGGERFLYRRQP